jgi:hypothetical protein
MTDYEIAVKILENNGYCFTSNTRDPYWWHNKIGTPVISDRYLNINPRSEIVSLGFHWDAEVARLPSIHGSISARIPPGSLTLAPQAQIVGSATINTQQISDYNTAVKILANNGWTLDALTLMWGNLYSSCRISDQLLAANPKGTISASTNFIWDDEIQKLNGGAFVVHGKRSFPTNIANNWIWSSDSLWDEEPTVKINIGCSHDWVLYTGLQEQFYHCKSCGKKKE